MELETNVPLGGAARSERNNLDSTPIVEWPDGKTSPCFCPCRTRYQCTANANDIPRHSDPSSWIPLQLRNFRFLSPIAGSVCNGRLRWRWIDALSSEGRRGWRRCRDHRPTVACRAWRMNRATCRVPTCRWCWTHERWRRLLTIARCTGLVHLV